MVTSMTVSIIIAAYNYEKYVEACIRSCINQREFDDYEIILVDDCSTDKTLEIAQKYTSRIKIFPNESNLGIERTLNNGIQQSKGDYIVRVDADDMLHEEYLSNIVPNIRKNKFAFVYPEYFIIDENNRIVEHIKLPDFYEDEIRKRGDFLASGTMYNKYVLEKMGLHSEKVKNCGLENYEMILNILQKNFKGWCLHKPLFYYRRHSANLSLKKRQAIISYGNHIAASFGLDKYSTNENHPWGLKL